MGRIKLLVMDVDGTLTDGKIYMGENGEVMKAFNIKDGYAIAHMLPEMGIIPVIITGRESRIVANRAEELGITELYQGISNKLSQLKKVAEKYNVTSEEIAYIGDDLNDLECIEYCGFSVCPSDADENLKNSVNYVCQSDGGTGAVREFVQYKLMRQYK